ncbi:MAG: tail protein X [Synergistaceae bacterium]|nr:tail protein X [Synergistaceae bacterium]
MKTYRTVQGDTWDLIAFKLWPKIGGEKLTDILIEANPEHVHTVVFSANIMINIPDADVPVVVNLPAWKR